MGVCLSGHPVPRPGAHPASLSLSSEHLRWYPYPAHRRQLRASRPRLPPRSVFFLRCAPFSPLGRAELRQGIDAISTLAKSEPLVRPPTRVLHYQLPWS